MKRRQRQFHLLIWPLLAIALVIVVYLSLGNRQPSPVIEFTTPLPAESS